MKFVIRDDDLNYFNEPSDIERWYKDIFALGIPVGFSTIPFVKPISDAWIGERVKAVPKEDKEYPIGRNKALVEYVRQNSLIEIIQHGCTHETKNGVFEFCKAKGLFEETKRGKDELEREFGRKITVFVPPHDAISNHGIRAVEAAGMNIIRGVGMKNFLWRPQYVAAGFKMAFHRLRFPIKSRMPAYPYVIDLGMHKEAYAVRLNDNQDNREYLLRCLRFVSVSRGNFIVVNHLAVTNEKQMETLAILIQEAKNLGFVFVPPSKLFQV
jgi:peptidoglycan/xylan/chitin deacetylase (PgdA/CDA1 family)